MNNYIILVIVIFLQGCNWMENNEEENKNILARVGNSTLYKKDILYNPSLGDSAQVYSTQINLWIKKQLVLNSTFQSDEIMNNIQNKVDQYKESLMLFEFEKYLALYRKDINCLNVAVSMLNVYDLKDIEKHYNMPIEWAAVINPNTLSIRHIPDKDKVRYIPNKEIEDELFKEANNDMYRKGVEYVNKLEAHRGLKYGH